MKKSKQIEKYNQKLLELCTHFCVCVWFDELLLHIIVCGRIPHRMKLCLTTQRVIYYYNL